MAVSGWRCGYLWYYMSAMYKHPLPGPLKGQWRVLVIKRRSFWWQDKGKGSSSLLFYGFMRNIMSPRALQASNIHPPFSFMAFLSHTCLSPLLFLMIPSSWNCSYITTHTKASMKRSSDLYFCNWNLKNFKILPSMNGGTDSTLCVCAAFEYIRCNFQKKYYC